MEWVRRWMRADEAVLGGQMAVEGRMCGIWGTGGQVWRWR
jgi:hypothetical protein